MIEQLDPHITPQLERSALLVIDTQVDFVDGGVFPVLVGYLAARCRAL